jgi:hypothetical protein
MKLYKDECDVCNKWDYCSGYNGLVLCNKCISKAKENKPEPVKKESTNANQITKKQISLFD